MSATWHAEGLCRDHHTPDLWHPASAKDDAAREAKTICRVCPVRALCADEALNDPTLSGVWGGLTANQRTRMRNAG